MSDLSLCCSQLRMELQLVCLAASVSGCLYSLLETVSVERKTAVSSQLPASV